MSLAEPLRRTVLYERHVALGGRMVGFGGWELPVQYRGIVEEHRAVRSDAGIFDVSHMGEIEVHGPDALAFLQSVLTRDVASFPVGQAGYALICQPDGGIIDDVFVYHLADRWLVVVNAANSARDLAWFRQHAAGFAVTIDDRSAQTALVALQGPRAEALLQVFDAGLAALPYHGVAAGRIAGIGDVRVARTGYTGEDGFEIFCDTADAGALWDRLLAAGATPCGLGARDSLRFEACLALYGHEIDAQVNPFEARLGWAVQLDRSDFIGRDALRAIKAAGPGRRLVGFTMVGRGIARSGYAVQDIDGTPIGHVTSGMPAPTVGGHLGMALLASSAAAPGASFDVIIRERPVRAASLRMPFYPSRRRRTRD